MWLLVAGARPVRAQAGGGVLIGRVQDTRGRSLSGAQVVLQAPWGTVRNDRTDAAGHFRFVGLRPSSGYRLTVRRDGWEVTWLKIQVTRGRTRYLDLSIDTGQQRIVRSSDPGIPFFLPATVLHQLPTARDPWSLLDLAPGILLDRQNNGETAGNQSRFTARGMPPGAARWYVNGLSRDDAADPGLSTAYYDYETLESVEVLTVNQDLDQFTGGPQIHLELLEPPGQMSVGGHLFASGKSLQAQDRRNHAGDFFNPWSRVPRVNSWLDFGARFGGPLLPGRFWGWAAVASQMLRLQDQPGMAPAMDLLYGTVRLDASWGAHELGLLAMGSQRTKSDRGVSVFRSPETLWDQADRTPFLALQDHIRFGQRSALTLSVLYDGPEFRLQPNGGRQRPVTLDLGTGIWGGSFTWQQRDQNLLHVSASVVHVRTQGPGGMHEIRVGTEFRWATLTTASGVGNGAVYVTYPSNAGPGFGEVWLFRERRTRTWVRRVGGYLEDTFTRGRLQVALGVRLDWQASGFRNSQVTANRLFGDASARWLPGGGSGAKRVVSALSLSPRLQLTLDLLGNGRTRFLAGSRLYPDVVDIEPALLLMPTVLREVDFWWFADLNGDRIPQANEVDFSFPLFWDHVPGDPNRVLNAVAEDVRLGRTWEAVAGFEQKMFGFTLGVYGIYRRREHTTWTFPYDPDGRFGAAQYYDCWVEAGRIPANFGGWPYYFCTLPRPAGVRWQNRPGFFTTYRALEIRWTRPFSRRWWWYGSATYQDWTRHLATPQAWLDPTNRQQLDGAAMAFPMFGTGREIVYPNARWVVRMALVGRLPLDFTAGISLIAREGYVQAAAYRANRPSHGWDGFVDVLVDPFGKRRYPVFWQIHLHLARTLHLGGRLRIQMMADAFNITNNSIVLGRFSRVDLPHWFGRITELGPPRLVRLGLRILY